MDSKEVYDYILKIQSIAKIGLIYSKDPYALSNYKEINDLSIKFLEKFMEVKFDRPNYFKLDIYPTPSISVRAVIFNENRSKVLMVREVNSHKYSLPGGWADLYDSASQTAVNESLQEAGAKVEAVRLVALTNRTPFLSDVSVPQYLAAFECKLIGELGEHEYETDDVGWFDIDNLPEISRKTSMEEMRRILIAARDKETIFD